jgi:hypothetical protein
MAWLTPRGVPRFVLTEPAKEPRKCGVRRCTNGGSLAAVGTGPGKRGTSVLVGGKGSAGWGAISTGSALPLSGALLRVRQTDRVDNPAAAFPDRTHGRSRESIM